MNPAYIDDLTGEARKRGDTQRTSLAAVPPGGASGVERKPTWLDLAKL